MGLLSDMKSRKKMSDLLLQHSRKSIILTYVAGIVWFALLASDTFNNKTYFSENALLPGLVVREFNPKSSLPRLLDSLKEEVTSHPGSIPSAWIMGRFRQLGLEVYENNFTVHYPLGSKPISKAKNLYAVLRAPKTASTESLVISTPYRDFNSINDNSLASIALMVELAQAFRRHAYWSKDIIFLITEYENIGFQAWLDAYHGVSTSQHIISEKIRSSSGLIQGVINLEISNFKFSHIDVKIEGLHGQLPNLDLFNLVIELCNREQIPATFQSRFNFYPGKPITFENWQHNFITMSKMIMLQATGLQTGGHGLFHRFGIQAITLKSVQDTSGGSVNLIQLGRVIEGTIRSLNNLLEKFHQSFFFYLLPSTRSYISIGLYMLPFSLISLPVLIKALHVYFQIQSTEADSEVVPRVNYWALGDVVSRHGFYGFLMLCSPLYLDYIRGYFHFSTTDLLYYSQMVLVLTCFFIVNCSNLYHKVSKNEFLCQLCLILLMLGGCMFTLALVNISFALIFAVLYAPISTTLQYRGRLSFLQYLYLLLINPVVFTYLVVVCQSFSMDTSIAWYTHLLRALEGHKKLVLFSVEDMYFFGNWNYKLVILIISPLWLNLWSLKTLKVE